MWPCARAFNNRIGFEEQLNKRKARRSRSRRAQRIKRTAESSTSKSYD